MSPRRALPLLAVSLMMLGLHSAVATQNVTSVSTTYTPGGSTSPAEGFVYENNERTLNGFSTGTNNYSVASLANNVFVRRNPGIANQSSMWYTSSGNGTNLSGSHESSYANMLLSNSVLSGSDNTFANVGGSQAGNIERIDFTWNSAITVNNALAFAVFDRGAAGLHDGFGIAAVTGIDAFGNPTAFGSLLKVASNWGAATNPIADMDYRLFRYSNGDDITATTDSTSVATQGVGGIVISAADLGLVNGTSVYGYALMGYDVSATNSAQLLDYLNATYFPTTTDGATGGGGIDLASFNGFQIVAVPEPMTLPAILLVGAIFAGCNFVRARRVRTARA